MVGNVQAPWDVHPSPTLCGQWLKDLIAMDRRTLLGALGLALAAPLGSASAAEPPKYTRPGRVYNQNGAYEGRMDSSGRMYDQSGRYVGREDSSGRRYDASGRYQGRTDADGRRYDSSGRYQGKTR